MAAPTVSSIDPAFGLPGRQHYITVNGADLADVSAADFGAGITVNAINVVNDYQVVVDLTIDGGASPGPRDVTLTNPDGSGTLEAGFRASKGYQLEPASFVEILGEDEDWFLARQNGTSMREEPAPGYGLPALTTDTPWHIPNEYHVSRIFAAFSLSEVPLNETILAARLVGSGRNSYWGEGGGPGGMLGYIRTYAFTGYYPFSVGDFYEFAGPYSDPVELSSGPSKLPFEMPLVHLSVLDTIASYRNSGSDFQVVLRCKGDAEAIFPDWNDSYETCDTEYVSGLKLIVETDGGPAPPAGAAIASAVPVFRAFPPTCIVV